MSQILGLDFICLFCRFFDHKKQDNKEHDHLKHETIEKYQSWIESKIGSNPNSENKVKHWDSICPHPPPPPSISQFIKFDCVGRKLKNCSPSIIPHHTCLSQTVNRSYIPLKKNVNVLRLPSLIPPASRKRRVDLPLPWKETINGPTPHHTTPLSVSLLNS